MTPLDLSSTTESVATQLLRAAELLRADWPQGETVDVAVVGQAGSAGKTTAAVTLASCLAQVGLNVEMVDADGQGNASKHLGVGVNWYPDDGLLDLSQGPAPLTMGDAMSDRECYVPHEDTKRQVTFNDIRRSALNPTDVPGYGVVVDPDDPYAEETRAWLSRISLYPNGYSYSSGQRHSFFSDDYAMATTPLGPAKLMSSVQELDTQPHVRFWDLHGTTSLIMYTALSVANWAFTAVTLDDKTTGQDLDYLIHDTITEIRGANKKLALRMIIPSRIKPSFQGGNIGRKMLKRLVARHGSLVPQTLAPASEVPETSSPSAELAEQPIGIRETVTVQEAYHQREPLTMWVPDDRVTDDYRRTLLWAITNGLFQPN